MSLSHLVFLSIIFLFLNACSSLSKSECEQGDWRSIGIEDAVKGARAETKLSQHSKACSKHDINPDDSVYFSGYTEGLKLFCTSRRGYSFGASGYTYLDTCPTPLKPAFVSGYISGLDLAIHKLNEDIDDLRFERIRKDRRLLSLERQHIRYSDKEKPKSSERMRIHRNQLKSLHRRISLISERDELVALYHKWSHAHIHTHTH